MKLPFRWVDSIPSRLIHSFNMNSSSASWIEYSFDGLCSQVEGKICKHCRKARKSRQCNGWSMDKKSIEWSTITNAYPLLSEWLYSLSEEKGNALNKRWISFAISFEWKLVRTEKATIPQMKNVICNIEVKSVQKTKDWNHPAIYSLWVKTNETVGAIEGLTLQSLWINNKEKGNRFSQLKKVCFEIGIYIQFHSSNIPASKGIALIARE